MPADDLYWNPMDLDSDESILYPKQYIDPWDLENYAYIRQHLDSVDLNSDPSSLGEPQETAFYYVPAKPRSNDPYYHPTKSGREHEDFYYSPQNKYEKYESLIRSEHGTANYAAIDEVVVQNEGVGSNRRRSQISRKGIERERYDGRYIDEPDYETENPYAIGMRDEASMQIYESSKPRRKRSTAKNITPPQKTSRSHRHSQSIGEEYDPYGVVHPGHQPLYNGTEDIYVKPDYYDSAGTSPIYDDIRIHRSKPTHFKLSNYGHLEIDYSCSWNNLNKYIYN